MKRLVGNPQPVDDGVGDKSCGFSPQLADSWYGHHMGDPAIRQDVSALCADFLTMGYIVDRVDAYYAWCEFSIAHSASWLEMLGGTGIASEACMRFLIEDDTPTTPFDYSKLLGAP